MNDDWRELLCRALDAETLSEAEAEQLYAALDDNANWQEARTWLEFEQTIIDRWQVDEVISSSRERLIAKSILRGKQRELADRTVSIRKVLPDAEVGSRSRRWLPFAVLVATLFVALTIWWPESPATNYALPLVRGDFHILGPDSESMWVARGDRLVSGGNGAHLSLGGYCDVNLVSHTEVTLQGEPHREAIELHQGALRARVTPDQGEFRVLTPLGFVDVKGTEFETSVEYPNGFPGDQRMNSPVKRVLVSVAVLSGTVLCQLGDSSVLLEQGATQVFAGETENRSTKGEVTEVSDDSVTLFADGKSFTFQVPRDNKLAIHEASQLLKGDKIVVSWIEEGDLKWIRDIDGEGVIEGKVTALGDAWIEVGVEGGQKLRYRAPWVGGNPADGGGPDREVVQKLGALRVGNRVSLTWAMPEGKRVVNVVVREGGEQSLATAEDGDLTKAPSELYGFSGRVIGRLVEKDVEKGELTLQIKSVDRVWKNNKAKDAKSAEGRTLKIDGVFGKFLDVLLTLEVGDGVQIEVKHVRGDGLTFLGEELKQVAIEEDLQPTSEADQKTADVPEGLNGFRGILIGELVAKDVEQGTLSFKMEKVSRVWKQNKAPAPEKSVGKQLKVDGITGKFLDTLLVLETGDRIEVEAFHIHGETLKFSGEWLKKAE
jgi:hypothetical protein